MNYGEACDLACAVYNDLTGTLENGGLRSVQELRLMFDETLEDWPNETYWTYCWVRYFCGH